MEIDVSGDRIRLDKELNDLDRLVLDFVRILDRNSIKYAIVPAYVSILFGRSRSSEDVDIIVEEMPEAKFLALWEGASKKKFDCLVPDNPESAYRNYLAAGAPLRFARKGEFVPNVEIKFPAVREIDSWVLDKSRQVLLNGKTIRISPIELQIAYKLFLSTDKDIEEDARHLYKLFKEKLDKDMLQGFLKKLDKQGGFNKYLA